MVNWRQFETVTYTERVADGDNKLHEIGLASINAIGQGSYQFYMAEGRQWFQEKFGFDVGDIPDGRRDLGQRLSAVLSWSKMLASTDSYSVDGQRVELPREWFHPETFFNAFPPAVMNDWLNKADRINPELFDVLPDLENPELSHREPDPKGEGVADSM